MVVFPENTTGWSALYDAHIIQAVWDMYTAAMGSWFILGLFVVTQAMVYLKTRSLTLGFVLTVLFIAMFVAPLSLTGAYISTAQISILILMAVGFLTGMALEAFLK